MDPWLAAAENCTMQENGGKVSFLRISSESCMMWEGAGTFLPDCRLEQAFLRFISRVQGMCLLPFVLDKKTGAPISMK